MIGMGLRGWELTRLRWCVTDFYEVTIGVNPTYGHRTEGSKKAYSFNVNTTKIPVSNRQVLVLDFAKGYFLMEKEKHEC